MKIGQIEGTPEEIKGLFDNNGLNLAQYINANQAIPNPKKHGIFLTIIIIAFVILNCCLWIFDCPDAVKKILIVLDFTTLAIAIFLIHQKYDKYVLSGFSILIGMTIMSICLGYLTPKEAIKKIEDKSPLKEKEK
ncbi:MAG TPA: hypothetical protein VK172_03145 [Lentimicrobium sp.]|nr:hypothetical protein [Lentimicrobium sp.]